MSDGWKCDKCGKFFTPDYTGNHTLAKVIPRIDKPIAIDLCGDCKKRFDLWLETKPYLGTECTFLVLDEMAYLSKDSLPYGWPVFEDGTPIKEWDEVLGQDGHGFVAHCFSRYSKWWCVSSSHGYAARSGTGVFKRPTKDQMAVYYKKWPKEKNERVKYVINADGTVWSTINYMPDSGLNLADDVYKPNPFVGLVRGKHWERHEASDYYCGRCGWKVTDHDSYCPECGGALHGGGARKARENTNESVDHPKHYDNGKIECIDWIEERLSPEEFKGYLLGNALKYSFRYEDKGKPVEDLRKAQWYLKKLEELA